MTLAEFLDRIPKRRGWYLRYSGAITDEHGCCPLTARANMPAHRYIECARKMRMPERLARRIACAADNQGEPELRRTLLKALNLKERE